MIKFKLIWESEIKGEPENKELAFFQYKGKPIFENAISLLVYSPETIFAEKLETAISKGEANSRMKDYHDLLLLLLREKNLINLKKPKTTIFNTFQKRNTTASLIEFKKEELETLQNLWEKHLKNLSDMAQELDLPKNILLVIEEINNFILPVISDLNILSQNK